MTKKYFLFIALTALALSNLPAAALAQTATLYFSPNSGAFSQGGTFWLAIMADTKGAAVNAIAAYFSYPEDKLEPLGVSTAGSVMTIWAEKNAAGGKVEIAAGLPTPGFSGIKKIASVGFKAKVSSGSVNFKFTDNSAILTDAENKNILNLALSGQGNYNFISPPPATGKTPEKTPGPTGQAKPPLISEPLVKEITRSQATISWQTDQKADTNIEYGLTSNLGLTKSDARSTTTHALKLSDLTPATRYYYQIKSEAASGQEATSSISTFITLGYIGEIKILDSVTNQPLTNVQVSSLLPEETNKTADQEGKAVFDTLPLGKQWIAVRYQDSSFVYQIEVLDKEEPQVFEIKVPVPRAKTSVSTVLLILVVVALVIVAAWTFIDERLSKRKTKLAVITKPEQTAPPANPPQQ